MFVLCNIFYVVNTFVVITFIQTALCFTDLYGEKKQQSFRVLFYFSRCNKKKKRTLNDCCFFFPIQVGETQGCLNKGYYNKGIDHIKNVTQNKHNCLEHRKIKIPPHKYFF